jgi:hypothetical protein
MARRFSFSVRQTRWGCVALSLLTKRCTLDRNRGNRFARPDPGRYAGRSSQPLELRANHFSQALAPAPHPNAGSRNGWFRLCRPCSFAGDRNGRDWQAQIPADRFAMIEVGSDTHYYIRVFAMNTTFNEVEKEWNRRSKAC